MKKSHEKEEREACTFKPAILKYKKSDSAGPVKRNSKDQQTEGPVAEFARKPQHAKVSTTEPTADRCMMLYELSKNFGKKEDKPTDLYKYEKEQKEYTFVPNTKKEEAKDIMISAGMVDKTVERMRNARAERERVNKALERGSDDCAMRFNVEKNKFGGNFQQFSNAKESSMKRSGKVSNELEPSSQQMSKEDRRLEAPFSAEISPQPVKTNEDGLSQRTSGTNELVPADNFIGSGRVPENKTSSETREALLFIDVNLGNKQKRIIVYKGDTAVGLAESFAKENGILLIYI